MDKEKFKINARQTRNAERENTSEEKSGKIKLMISMVITLLFLASCGSSEKDSQTTVEDLKEEVSDIADVTENYSEEQWDKINAEIDEKMQKVSNEYNELNDALKAKFKNKKAELDTQKEQLQKKIKELNQAAAEKKETLKQEVNQLKTALDESLATFQQEMADEATEKK